jgi:hypothetical protein
MISNKKPKLKQNSNKKILPNAIQLQENKINGQSALRNQIEDHFGLIQFQINKWGR